uniref:Sushi domain-containing protein n=1 Tax=Sinocyclocheilus rhinocerous TaxID=307959 RepID=A0A673JVF1_9TELE
SNPPEQPSNRDKFASINKHDSNFLISEFNFCGPPPDVNFADTIELKKEEYKTRETAEYSCFSKYTLDLRPPFSRYLTCEQGEWRGNIRCLSKYEHASPYISYKHIMM